jgi:hypothetical protein
MKQTKNRLFRKNITEGANVLCVDAMEITVAGGSLFLFCCSAAAAEAATTTGTTMAAVTTAAADAD